MSLRATRSNLPGGWQKNYVILNEVKNPTDELTVHILLTKVVGYFAIAQYDVLGLGDCRGCFGPYSTIKAIALQKPDGF